MSYNFQRRRDQFVIDGQTIFLIEPPESDYQTYERRFRSIDFENPQERRRLAQARVALILLYLADEKGQNLLASNQITEAEVKAWPIRITKAIEERCLAIKEEIDKKDLGESSEETSSSGSFSD